ncbi:MAG: lipoate--protein ligase family protein [Thermoplasmata archaeon]|nr:MAG: lipoate--protein ligase family protein [Thermoplasmata archaeon]
MEKWRLLVHGARDAFTNMAIDESLLISGKPTIRFYKWKPSAISIGYFQGIEEEVNLKECEKHGIDVVRRISGGGAVFHDEKGEITYSLIAPEEMLPENILASCDKICSSIAHGLGYMGVDAEFSPLNDIVVNGRKISGSAQTRRQGNVLQHGTILIDLNAELMFSLLNVSAKKIEDKGIKKASKRVTCLQAEVGKVNENELIKALVRGFEEGFGIQLAEGKMDDEEMSRVKKLREKYESREWNFKR